MNIKNLRLIGIFFIFLAATFAIFLSSSTTSLNGNTLCDAVLDNYSTDTKIENSVTSIYLNYRIFDTIFEALMLLVSVIGVVHFSFHDKHIEVHQENVQHKKVNPNIIRNNIAIVIPLILLFGFYLIYNGANSPGGGFQGGAALASAMICVYLIKPEKNINFSTYEKIEKILFLTLAILAVLFAVSSSYFNHSEENYIYILIANSLIGGKVFCGLSIIFFRFVHFEDKQI